MKSLLFASMLSVAGAAQAHLTIFEGTFAPEAAGATGSGTLRLEYDELDNTLFIQADWKGLSGTTANAHIHCCTAAPFTGTAGVALAENGRLPGFAAGITDAYTRVIDLSLTTMYGGGFVTASGGTANGARDRLLANLTSGQAYFNIHTSTFGGGEIRAFVTQVPEPQTCAMLIAGLGVLGWAARRTRTQA
ncbi:CHRD domain-containing protein [Pseudaquabacterium pictum]|uniref:CHRD domain-containing protein n=1 Tax=Pseudaquabacterium pictum TaxID=2315236 RepID=A0A480AVF1_9BURK|nr:CHRD domain-containing protein [Rubrivivax pictus]GCL64152.1 hypothetical protein AQPW35_32330 [Rubrivivax pictus]